MSRYYKITIGAAGANQGGDGGGTAGATFTNMVNGAADPGAQLVEINVQAASFATPVGASFIRIWGVSLQQISQASDFNGAPITVEAGMQPGLPLATAAVAANQAGVIVEGTIQAAFGNWMGTAQTLDFVIIPLQQSTQSTPANIVLNWKKGTKLSQALQSTLSTAFPSYALNINISDNLVLTQDQAGHYPTLETLAQYLKPMSTGIITSGYAGVDMIAGQNSITIYDGTTQSSPIEIKFQDLIGQPTWMSAFTVQFNTVMRADIQVGDFVKFPPLSLLQTTTTPQSQSQARDKSTFTGVFQIGSPIIHNGNSRAPGAQSWISRFEAYSAGSPDQTTALGNTAA